MFEEYFGFVWVGIGVSSFLAAMKILASYRTAMIKLKKKTPDEKAKEGFEGIWQWVERATPANIGIMENKLAEIKQRNPQGDFKKEEGEIAMLKTVAGITNHPLFEMAKPLIKNKAESIVNGLLRGLK